MKKIYLFILLAAMACNKTKTPEQVVEQKSQQAVVDTLKFKCEVLYPSDAYRAVNKIAFKQPSVIPDSSACLGMFYAIDYATYVECSSDTNVVLKKLLCHFNGVRKQYAMAGVRVYISGYMIHKTPDPYESAMSSTQGLILFSAAMDSLNLPHDKFQLLSRHCVGCGGASWQGPTLGYGAYYNSSFCGMLPGFGSDGEGFPLDWNIMVMSHEQAHGVASRHTHEPVWNGNNTMIDSCACAANSGYCNAGVTVGGGNQPLPSNGGTTMSYCHLLQNVQINGALGFGPQPSESLRYAVEAANVTGGILHNPNGLGCIYPNVTYGITTTATAEIGWSSGDPGTKYKYRYRLNQSGSVWIYTSPTNIFATTASITGLQANTSYIYQIKPNCNTVWGGPRKFKTK